MKNILKKYIYGLIVGFIFTGCFQGGIPSDKPLSDIGDNETFIDKRLIGSWGNGYIKFKYYSNTLKYCFLDSKTEKYKCERAFSTKLNSKTYINIFDSKENRYNIFRYDIQDNKIIVFDKNKDISILDDIKNKKIKGVITKDNGLDYLSDSKENLQKYIPSILTGSDENMILYKNFATNLNYWYKKQYALVIGISHYKNSNIPYLPNAKNDAKSVEKLLRKYGFRVTTLIDNEATKKNIQKAIKEINKKISAKDSIILYFAGHGKGIKLKNGERIGYIIPYDFNQNITSNDPIDYDENAISLDNLKKYTKNFSAKHIMLMLDSCFSGLTFNTRALTQPKSGDMNYYDKLLKRKAINILTAGADEVVADGKGQHSPFTYYLLKALDNGNIDIEDGDHFATFSELASYIKTKVAKETNGRQTPQFDKNNEDGEFIFQVHEK